MNKNPIKPLLIYHTQEDRYATMSENAFRTLKTDPRNYFWINKGYEMPPNVLSCWYVDENERMDSNRNKKPFGNGLTEEYFLITKRIDNTFIEGYLGRSDFKLAYINEFVPNLAYFINYNKHEKIYFTFDKISLYQVMEIIPENPLKFILKRLDNNRPFKRNQAFMIMPFRYEELNDFYFNHVKKCLTDNLNIVVYRSDDFLDNDVIIETIYRKLEESEFIIADTTYENKNAFYELGYAAALNKEIITIQNFKAKEKRFFDRAHIRCVSYDTKNLDQFKFELTETIKSIRSRY